MIGALQKILNKTTEVETKSEVEEYVARIITLTNGNKIDRLLKIFLFSD